MSWACRPLAALGRARHRVALPPPRLWHEPLLVLPGVHGGVGSGSAASAFSSSSGTSGTGSGSDTAAAAAAGLPVPGVEATYAESNRFASAQKFVDKARIRCVAGQGGSGCVSFEVFGPSWRRPSGGHGGPGGDVEIVADPSVTSLNFERHHYRARNGQNGGSKNARGRRGDTLVLRVPLGTMVKRIVPREQVGPDGVWEGDRVVEPEERAPKGKKELAGRGRRHRPGRSRARGGDSKEIDPSKFMHATSLVDVSGRGGAAGTAGVAEAAEGGEDEDDDEYDYARDELEALEALEGSEGSEGNEGSEGGEGERDDGWDELDDDELTDDELEALLDDNETVRRDGADRQLDQLGRHRQFFEKLSEDDLEVKRAARQRTHRHT